MLPLQRSGIFAGQRPQPPFVINEDRAEELGVVAWYPMVAPYADATRILDLSKYRNHLTPATPANTSVFATEHGTVPLGDHVTGGDRFLVDDGAALTAFPLTMMGWGLVTVTTGADQALFWIGDSTSGGAYYTLTFDGSGGTGLGPGFVARNTAVRRASLGSLGTVNTWNHYAGVERGGAVDREFYYDGESVGTNAIASAFMTQNRIGVYANLDTSPGQGWMGGGVDLVLCNRELTPDEINAHQERGPLVDLAYPLGQRAFFIGAIGEAVSPTGTLDAATAESNGRHIKLTFAGMTASGITGFETGTAATVDLTHEGYSGVTLGTTSKTGLETVFVSATQNGSDAEILLDVVGQYIYDEDTSVIVDVDAGAFDDGTNTSLVAVDFAVTNNSTKPYLTPRGGIVGVIEGSSLKVEFDTVTDDFRVEAMGGGSDSQNGNPLAAVRFTVTDGVTPQTVTITDMTRSTYDPDRFYAQGVTDGVFASDPFAANGGGSGVFDSGLFDASALNSGSITITAELFPVVGDADDVVTHTWTMYNEVGGALTVVDRYVDSRAGITHGAVTGTFTIGEEIVQTTSGATGVFRFTSGGTMAFCQGNNTDFDGTNVITGQSSGATTTPTAAPVYNGDDTNAGTSAGAPYRRIQEAYDDTQGGSTGNKYNIYLMGDTSDPSYYGSGRDAGTNNDISTWATVQPNSGLTKSDIVIVAGDFGGDLTLHLTRKLHLKDLTIWHSFPGADEARIFGGRSTLPTALWAENCHFILPDGKGVGTSKPGTWYITQYEDQQGMYFTDCQLGPWHHVAMDDCLLARDCVTPSCDTDMFNMTGGRIMEFYVADNEEIGTGGHHDVIQQNSLVDSQTFFYNVLAFNSHDGQILFMEKAEGQVIINMVSTADQIAGGVGRSQFGGGAADPGNRNVNSVFANVCLPNNNFITVSAGAEENNKAFLINSVLGRHTSSSTADEDRRLLRMRKVHIIDSGSAVQFHGSETTTGQPAWTNGVDESAVDSASARNYHPTEADQTGVLANLTAAQIYCKFALDGAALATDGTAVVGPLQVPAAAGGGGGGTVSGGVSPNDGVSIPPAVAPTAGVSKTGVSL